MTRVTQLYHVPVLKNREFTELSLHTDVKYYLGIKSSRTSSEPIWQQYVPQGIEAEDETFRMLDTAFFADQNAKVNQYFVDMSHA